MSIDVWTAVARRQTIVTTTEKLCRLKMIKRSPTLTLFVTYYKVSNAVLKQLLKANVSFSALLWRVRK